MIFHENSRTLRGFNRPFKPFLFSVVMTMTIVSQANFRGVDRGVEFPLSHVVAFLSGAAAVALIWGWVGKMHGAVMVGLAMAFFAYATRAALIQIETPWDQAIWFSLAQVIAIGGAYILEARSHHNGDDLGD